MNTYSVTRGYFLRLTGLLAAVSVVTSSCAGETQKVFENGSEAQSEQELQRRKSVYLEAWNQGGQFPKNAPDLTDCINKLLNASKSIPWSQKKVSQAQLPSIDANCSPALLAGQSEVKIPVSIPLIGGGSAPAMVTVVEGSPLAGGASGAGGGAGSISKEVVSQAAKIGLAVIATAIVVHGLPSIAQQLSADLFVNVKSFANADQAYLQSILDIFTNGAYADAVRIAAKLVQKGCSYNDDFGDLSSLNISSVLDPQWRPDLDGECPQLKNEMLIALARIAVKTGVFAAVPPPVRAVLTGAEFVLPIIMAQLPPHVGQLFGAKAADVVTFVTTQVVPKALK